jgi:hypothetical protein
VPPTLDCFVANAPRNDEAVAYPRVIVSARDRDAAGPTTGAI